MSQWLMPFMNTILLQQIMLAKERNERNMNGKEVYISPEIEIIKFDNEDVITTSEEVKPY